MQVHAGPPMKVQFKNIRIKVDAAALPAAVVQGIQDGTISLTDPATTVALLKLDAVVGLKGTVETVDGRVSAPFTVLLSPPTLVSATPASVARGTSAVLVLAGTNLLGAAAPTLAVPDGAVRLETTGEPTMTALSVKATVAPDAAIGPRLLVLQTSDGVATVRLAVVGTPPRAVKVLPPGAARGTTRV